MKLSRRLALNIAALIVGVVLLAIASLYGLIGLSDYFDAATDQYERLRHVYEVGHHAATARRLLLADQVDRAAVADTISSGRRAAEAAELGPGVIDRLGVAARRLNSDAPLRQVTPELNHALQQVAELARQIKDDIIANRQAAAAYLTTLVTAMTLLSVAILMAAGVLGVRQYRLARRLAESERLASVGYLAAGVAHEMNNPLAIIAGYAEAGLRRSVTSTGDAQGGERGAEADDSARRALRIIAEEAFRCKNITSQLLKLASPADSVRRAMDLGPVIRDVAEVVAGLPGFGDRQMRVEVSPGPLIVFGNESELRQVLLNLVTNAMEATGDQSGHVTIEAERVGGRVMVRVSDNGRGMAADVVKNLFQPFYTDKPQRGEQGTGLGLAVSQAIVQQHGGKLTASSAGPGRGSTFTLDLPAQREASHA